MTQITDKEIVNKFKELGNKSAVARELNINRSTVYMALGRHCAKTGENFDDYKNINYEAHEETEINIDSTLVSGQTLKGVSTLYGKKGQIKQQWVKTSPQIEAQVTAMERAAEALSKKIKKVKPTKHKGKVKDNLLSTYIISDYHFGMLAWEGETKEPWDMDIAEQVLIDWFAKAIDKAENAHTAVLVNLGDFLHYDSLVAVTPTSGHVLDAAGRFGDMVFRAVPIFVNIVYMMLEKHKNVHIIMAEGNHDITSSVWLRLFMRMHFENEPRVTVDTSHIPYYAYQWGETSLFFHHGHKVKHGNVSKSFAGIFRDMYGSTKYSYAHTGHLHHKDVKEDHLMEVEQHQTLAPNDAHGARGGFNSKRGAVVINYCKYEGEDSRYTIKPNTGKANVQAE